jgi:hypothetical protein
MENEITYNWDCKTTDVYPQFEQLNDVVYNVHWRLTGSTTVDDKDYYQQSIGTQMLSLEVIQPEGFIPFPEPSDVAACDAFAQQVTEWTIEAIGEDRVNELKASLATQIANQINPPSVTLTIGVSEPYNVNS